ncbi:Lymphoid-restricted membrane protein Jaw1 Processed lymphoid-restricted membrane protein [Larimichthys crocea]|uniref:Lymphoid-restricted membrane protein Jaw1 Processed lymphoid-restricted membrane protein n=1 Tax=Larimichthys crocea TaxID=215358 RepID=A0A6G0IQ41_LARCR|nr:Lymphoid-restricted membrane protein Jaw1 Processed lymphoid-restricted membrane protein [Larimichthys crocea]
MLGSEDSEEETSQEEPPVTNWNELSIIERVGLNSVEMSEKDLETAFSQITLAFSCDQYTLKQRLQAEEHARNLAEENVQLELSRGKETLEKLELSLDILGGTVDRISNTAEVLGAVHQEARVSRAVELMVAHVENLRSRYDRNAAELEEAKRTVQQPTYCIIEPRASPDPDDSDNKRIYVQQTGGRRRISASIISGKSQKKRAAHGGSSNKKSTRTCPSPSQSSESSCSVMTKEDNYSVDDRPLDPDETPSEASAAQVHPIPNPERLPAEQQATRKIQSKSSPLDTLRQRHKGKSASSKKKADKDKKSANIFRRVSAGTCGSLWRQRPLAHWLHRCRWVLIYLSVLFCIVTLTYFLLETS